MLIDLLRCGRRRRGFGTLPEAVVSVFLFSVLMVLLLTIFTHVIGWNREILLAVEADTKMDTFIQSLTMDVKSSLRLGYDPTLDALTMESTAGTVNYSLIAGTIYRNESPFIDGVVFFQHALTDTEIVNLYVLFDDGQKIALQLHR